MVKIRQRVVLKTRSIKGGSGVRVASRIKVGRGAKRFKV